MKMLSMGVSPSNKCFKRGREASVESQVRYDSGFFQRRHFFP